MAAQGDEQSLRRRRLILIAALAIALAVTLFFGVRAVRRFVNRPTDEPVRAWMSVPYIARAYGLRPPELSAALGLPDKAPDPRPLSDVARQLNITPEEMIARVEKAIKDLRSRQPGPPAPKAPPPTRAP